MSSPESDARLGAPAIRVVMMPKDTNALGTIFGGVILSYIDQAGAVEAHRHVAGRIVTVAMREVVFHAPVHVGDLVSFWTTHPQARHVRPSPCTWKSKRSVDTRAVLESR